MPKKARRGGGGKGGGKTEEERLLFLQQRAQAEEEMARKKEEILTLFLKDKLQKEERNTAVNLLKLNEGWRSILRVTRAAELRSDITVLSQTFERQLDGLDSVIETLERDLREAERQSAQVRRVHLQHVERLWTLQNKRLTLVQQQWERGVEHLSFRFSRERQQMLDHSERRQDDLEDATFTLEQQHQSVMAEINRLYEECIAAYKSAHNDRTVMVILQDYNNMEETALQMEEATQVLHHKKGSLDTQLAKNQELIVMTNADIRKMRMLQQSLIDMRMEMKSNETENQMTQQELTANTNQVKQQTCRLRDQMTRTHAAAGKQLADLTVQSDAAAKKLQAVIAKGEKILRITEMCHKLEREQEGVLPLLPPAEEHRQEPAERSEFQELQQLTWRVNTATLQREAVRKHKDDLRRENRQLRLLLRQHLFAMTLSDVTADGRHALLTVDRAPITTAAVTPDAGRRHTVVEAVHVLKDVL
ncbi:dynein regulatory complex subunit 2 [Pempheris klunzingeri]|uniref:dynein regulatory complex subunit 2 n=1 Tax=Pempheris klunzingeri TaxID=3127111 RepID=UPI0039814BF4